MNTNHTIVTELANTAPYLATVGNATPYQLPNADYFNSLPQQIALAIAAKNATYTVPDGYFHQLHHQIMANVGQQNSHSEAIATELSTIAPLLTTISKAPVYQVPNGYFEQPIAPKTTQTKVVSLSNTKKWLQYAAAAMVAGILVSGAFLATNKQQFNYEKYSRLDVKQGLKNVSDDDLVKYLDNAQYITQHQEITTLEAVAYTENVSVYLQNVSDEDLQQFLKETDHAKMN
jgi:hypothetical protein